jgi:hypothetical protein
MMIRKDDDLFSSQGKHIGRASQTTATINGKTYDRRGNDLIDTRTGKVVGHLSEVGTIEPKTDYLF